MKIGKVSKNTIWLVCSAFLISILLASSLLAACAQPAVFSTETVRPEDVGLSSDALNQIGTTLNADIADGKINGAVLLVARNGKTAYLKSFGTRDADGKLPMQTNSIFRIFSMTKSLTAVSVAMLMEEGKLALTDPVSKYIPAFKDIQVGEIVKDKDGNDAVNLVKPSREITIKDLATHTSGLGYWFLLPTATQNIYLQAGMADLEGLTNAEVCEKIAALPLMENPGTLYRYGMNYDVLGRVIEVVSGMTLDQFFAERIYKPLENEGFRVPGRSQRRRPPGLPGPHMAPLYGSDQPRQEILERRRGLGIDGPGLCALCPDAAQRRRARRRAPAETGKRGPYNFGPTGTAGRPQR